MTPNITDGAVLIGCSELTGRYWKGRVNVYNSINDIKDLTLKPKNSINLACSSTDGCFVGDSNKVILIFYNILSYTNTTSQNPLLRYIQFIFSRVIAIFQWLLYTVLFFEQPTKGRHFYGYTFF